MDLLQSRHMKSIHRLYDNVGVLLHEAGVGDYVEPVEHVLEVERLRQAYRPHGEVKFLLIAESHVRVSPDHFASKGSGFIYEHRYYTPWWPNSYSQPLARLNRQIRRTAIDR